MTHVKKYLKKKKKKRTLNNQKKKVLGEDTGEVSGLCWSAEESDASTQTVVQAAANFNTEHVSGCSCSYSTR